MYIQKTFSFRRILANNGQHLGYLALFATGFAWLYNKTNWDWMTVPWLPISVIGTAVAFYLGFKNNQAYDRIWEARKIWGAIVNDSRSWAATAKSYVSNQFRDKNLSEDELHEIRQKLIYRHIAWLYTLRKQLLVPTPWEHINQNFMVAAINKRRLKKIAHNMISEEKTIEILKKYIPDADFDQISKYKNSATHLIDHQSQDLQKLRANNIIDDFRHMEMQNILKEFYTHQGKCERIKKFPLPRQFGSMSFILVTIFVILLPFGMVHEFSKLGEWGIWFSIPFTVLISWVFIIMELVGDYSENPFEGLGNDIPMLSLTRTIEIDLLEMLGEKDLPPAIEAKDGVLM